MPLVNPTTKLPVTLPAFGVQLLIDSVTNTAVLMNVATGMPFDSSFPRPTPGPPPQKPPVTTISRLPRHGGGVFSKGFGGGGSITLRQLGQSSHGGVTSTGPASATAEAEDAGLSGDPTGTAGVDDSNVGVGPNLGISPPDAPPAPNVPAPPPSEVVPVNFEDTTVDVDTTAEANIADSTDADAANGLAGVGVSADDGSSDGGDGGDGGE